ncbi:hypothetical protein [Sphingomonas sp. LHG3443-2]|uniref:hypothetical protein n=1 Tax=Sphingomonas sp. LHG3443-2 TaxID=2804639 RepID=UPI003CEC4467
MMLALTAAAALATSAPAEPQMPAASDVTVERSGQRWTADFRLTGRAPVWMFVKSVLPRKSKTSWRLATVQVLTPGVRLVRIGNYDALVAAGGGALPARVRLQFTPFRDDIESGYDPALIFTDGSVALYGDQFWVTPARSAAEVRAMGPFEEGPGGQSFRTRMTFTDRAGPVLAKGQRVARAQMNNGGTYVLFGKAAPVVGPAMTTLLDPSLPSWISAYLNAEMPKVLGRYAQELGPSPVGQPTLMVTWGGLTPAQPDHASLSGSVLPGLVLMDFSGSKLQQPSDRAAQYARWFVSHEAAHFWLGQAVSYTTPAESWITEGGAELLAFRATAAADPTFSMSARLGEARAECAPFLKNGGVQSAYRREGDFRAYYACGALIALAAEKANGGDFGGFVRALIAGPGKDGEVSRAEWLQLLDQRAGNKRSSAAIADLLDRAHPDPVAALDRFAAETGIAAQFAPAAKAKP